MKANIHPENYKMIQASCASCGATFPIHTTKEELHLETCHLCHRAYTDKAAKVIQKGRLESFNQKFKKKINDQ